MCHRAEAEANPRNYPPETWEPSERWVLLPLLLPQCSRCLGPRPRRRQLTGGAGLGPGPSQFEEAVAGGRAGAARDGGEEGPCHEACGGHGGSHGGGHIDDNMGALTWTSSWMSIPSSVTEVPGLVLFRSTADPPSLPPSLCSSSSRPPHATCFAHPPSHLQQLTPRPTSSEAQTHKQKYTHLP